MPQNQTRILEERKVDRDVVSDRRGDASLRSVTINVTESPLGWLFARKFITRREYEAVERLRGDWERAQLSQRVTMSLDAAPVTRGRGWLGAQPDLGGSQIDAKRRFDSAIAAAGPGLTDILWRIVCAGEGMRDAETALGWPARSGRLVLTFALDRVADHYAIR